MKKAQPIVHKLALTLEELYSGTEKKMKITKSVFETSEVVKVEKLLTIQVKPGWRSGTKITFPQEGDQRPGVEPADVGTLLTYVV